LNKNNNYNKKPSSHQKDSLKNNKNNKNKKKEKIKIKK